MLKKILDSISNHQIFHMDGRCGCVECIKESEEDPLRFSTSRINQYRALASPSLIALSSSDPILTAFELSWDLRNLAFTEQENKAEYMVGIFFFCYLFCKSPTVRVRLGYSLRKRLKDKEVLRWKNYNFKVFSLGYFLITISMYL